MKKLFVLISALALLALCAACGEAGSASGASASQPAASQPAASQPAADTSAVSAPDAEIEIPRMFINSEPVVVTAKGSFDSAGVTAMLCDATETYSFTASSEDVTWSVFILDAPFTDGLRYLPQAETPALEGNGTLPIEEGKYIYILCSENAFTADAPSDAALTIDYAG